MNKVKLSLFALVAIVAASCVADPMMEGQNVAADKNATTVIINSSECAVAGKLFLYVDEATADAWSVSTTRSGNDQLDAVAEELGVETISPVFNMAMNADEKRAQGMHRWYVVEFDKEANLDAVAEKFAAISSVKRVQFCSKVEKPQLSAQPVSEDDVTITRADAEPFNDTMLPLQWHYNNKGQQSLFVGAKEGEDIGLYEAWKYTTGNPEIIVAVVDEGVKYDHPDLADNMWVNQAELNGQPGVDDDRNGYVDDIYGLNAVRGNGEIGWTTPAWNSEGYYVGDSGHGTHVAGTVAAVNNNGFGVAGVAGGDGSGNGVRIMSIQIFDGAKNSTLGGNAKGMEYAADNGAVILQNSWGYPNSTTQMSDGIYEASYGVELAGLKYFVRKSNCKALEGGIAIFAAGNQGLARADYPGAYRDLLCVTAYAPDGLPTSYTNYKFGCNVAAPGGETSLENRKWKYEGCVLSTLPRETYDALSSSLYNSDYGYMQGTSMACPHVSGVAALVLSYAVENGYYLTNAQFNDLMVSSVRNIDIDLVGYKQSWDGSGKIFNLALDNYRYNMGTGKLDALMAIMNVRGAQCVPVTVGEEAELKITTFIGSGDISVTPMKEFIISAETKSRLGITGETYFNGSIYLTCNNSGIGVVTVKYIAGGKAVGGGDTIGGRLMEKDIVIVARKANDNGGWL